MRMAVLYGMGRQSLIPPWGSAGAPARCRGLQSRHGAALEPRAGLGRAAMPLRAKDSKGSHAAPGKMPPWHQSPALHAPCLSFPTGETALAWSHREHSDTQHGSAATGPALPLAQDQPPHAAGCRGEACHAGKGDALSQPAQPAPAGSSTRWHNLPPQHGGGSRDVAAMAEQSCFPRGSQADTFIPPLFQAGQAPPCSLLSGKHPGGEAELPHSLFWAAFRPPPSPRVLHSYCLCRNSAAINPPLPTGAALPALHLPEPCLVCCSPPKNYRGSQCLARERGEAPCWKPNPNAHSHPSLPQHGEARPWGCPGWRWAGGSYEHPTRPPSWGRTGASHPRS